MTQAPKGERKLLPFALAEAMQQVIEAEPSRPRRSRDLPCAPPTGVMGSEQGLLGIAGLSALLGEGWGVRGEPLHRPVVAAGEGEEAGEAALPVDRNTFVLPRDLALDEREEVAVHRGR